jgi:dihydrofolate synthase/folylpolyglutamate synthase
MKFGLENISRLTAALGHPERTFTPVIVAGTNGKGSVTAMVHHALVAAGHKAGRYTSPHLVRFEERFTIGGREVERDTLEQAASEVKTAVEALVATGQLETFPTFFECATATAFVLFRQAGIAIAVLEVGLGGRLDATNIVTPVAAAITSIDLDHQAQLGDTIEAVAFEKAGVIKPGIPVVCGELPADAERVIRQVCADRSARFIAADRCPGAPKGLPGGLALRGAHQERNARVAACLLRELGRLGIAMTERAIEAALTEVEWPGRLEALMFGTTDVLLDAAHNPAGAAALAAYIRESQWNGGTLLFGVMADKDAAGMLSALAPHFSTIVCTTPDTPRALPAEQLAELARTAAGARWDLSTVAEPAAALAEAAGRGAPVVVAGSIFLIGPLRGILRPR